MVSIERQIANQKKEKKMGRKKKTAADKGPVFEAQRALVKAHVERWHELMSDHHNDAANAAELGRFDEVATAMMRARDASMVVRDEAKRFAESAEDVEIEYDEEETERRKKKGKKKPYSDDDDDDEEG